MNKMDKLCIYSYNSRGFNLDKQILCRKLLNSSGCTASILCNQENFILKSNGYVIKQALPGYLILFKPAVKESLDGRPRNGMFIAVPEIMKERIKDISPNHWRIQAALIQMDDLKRILIVNSYFPQDSKSPIYIDPELEETITEINNLLMNHSFDDVIWMGDINTDFDRNTKSVRRMETYLDETKLKRSWNYFSADYTHEFQKEEITYTCTIDHFFWNEKLGEKISEAGVLHLPDNLI